MTYRCKTDLLYTPIAVLICFFAFAACLRFASLREGTAKLILNGVGIILFAVAIKISDRFLLSKFVYVLEADAVKIYRIKGNTSVMLANISLLSCIGLSERGKYASFVKDIGGVSKKYVYTPNLFAKNKRTLFFESPEGKCAVTIDASDEFYTLLCSWMPAKNV